MELTSFFAYLAAGAVSLSVSLGALRAGVDDYLDGQKASAATVCFVQAQALQPEQRARMVEACTAKASAELANKAAPVRAILGTVPL